MNWKDYELRATWFGLGILIGIALAVLLQLPYSQTASKVSLIAPNAMIAEVARARSKKTNVFDKKLYCRIR